MSNLRQNGKLRWVASYLRRQGKMTMGQKKALRDHWSAFGIEFRYGETIDPVGHFLNTDGPLFLEVGFGMGENLVYQAEIHPEARILGIEVHKPGIGAALKKITEQKISNIRVMRGDARLILSDYLDENLQMDRISVLFPDPWPDRENAHRRIIQEDLIELFESRIAREGILHIATDVEVYRDHCLAVMAKRPGWERITHFDLKKFRGSTRYESKGISRGHLIHDLLFRRSTSVPARFIDPGRLDEPGGDARAPAANS